MQCKVFTLPLESQALVEGENRLNDFLKAAQVKRLFASIADPKVGTWSVMVFYEGASTAPPIFAPVPDGHSDQPPQPPSNFTSASRESTPATNVPPDAGPPLTSEQVRWIIGLKRWRADQAAQEGVPLYMVAQNRWLEDIVRMPARGVQDLLKIRGMGEWRAKKYGPKIVEILNGGYASAAASTSRVV